MKPKIYEAIKAFETRLEATSPGTTFRLTNSFGGHDIGVELFLPVTHIGRRERLKIAELVAGIEEEFDVYIGIIVKSQVNPSAFPT